MEVSPYGLIKGGFSLAWESQGQRCYHKKCTKRVSMFFIFKEDGSIFRAGMTTNDGVIFPLDKDADIDDVIAAQRIFCVKDL